jgi:hypothetical protein
VAWRYRAVVRRIQKKDRITAVFLLVYDSIWKYEGIYMLMKQDKRFNPVVVVVPCVFYDIEIMLEEMDRSYNSFLTKGYNVIKAYNETSKEWMDISNEIKPDIVFYTYPDNITKKKYYVHNFLNSLTVYVPYGIMTANIQQDQYDLIFHNMIWRCYYETVIHKAMARKYATNRGVNVSISGFPMGDIFLDNTLIPIDVWKNKNRDIKRIIWAPHYTIDENKRQYAYSNFLTDYQFMLDIAKQFEGAIQIAFKPHPVLKPTLYDNANWGKERTDVYYNTWQKISNGQLEEGSYEDLFLTSDAMILDSISFISEYLYTGKPSLFLIRNETIKTKFNEYGTLIFNLLYKSFNHRDIINFINQTVLKKEDPLLNERLNFINEYLRPPNNQTASQNIFNDIINHIKL